MSEKNLIKWLAIASALALVLGFAASCASTQASSADRESAAAGGDNIPPELVGTWTGSGGARMVINADGNGTSTPGNVFSPVVMTIPDTAAVFTVTGNELVITIPGQGVDSFTYTITDNALTLSAVSGQFSGDIAAKSPFTKQ